MYIWHGTKPLPKRSKSTPVVEDATEGATKCRFLHICTEIGFFFHQIETGDMVPVELTNYDNSIKKCNSAHMACICMDVTGLTPKSFRIIYLILK
jgi:hypothetical protein